MSSSQEKVAAGGMIFCVAAAAATGGLSLFGVPAIATALGIRKLRDRYADTEDDKPPTERSFDMNVLDLPSQPVNDVWSNCLPAYPQNPLSVLAERSSFLAHEVMMERIHAEANVGALNSHVAAIYASQGKGTAVRTTSRRSFFGTSTTTVIRPIG